MYKHLLEKEEEIYVRGKDQFATEFATKRSLDGYRDQSGKNRLCLLSHLS